MPELNVKDKNKAMKDFFTAYAGDIDGSLKKMSRVELLEHLGKFDETSGGDRSDPECYTGDDIFIGVASAATGIPESEFVAFAVKHFKAK